MSWKLCVLGLWLAALFATGIAIFEVFRSWGMLTNRSSFAEQPNSLEAILGSTSWSGVYRVLLACIGLPLLFVLKTARLSWIELALFAASLLTIFALAWFAAYRGHPRLSGLLEGATIVPLLAIVVLTRGSWNARLLQFAWLAGIVAAILLPLWLGLIWVRKVPGPRSGAAARGRVLGCLVVMLCIGWIVCWWIPHL